MKRNIWILGSIGALAALIAFGFGIGSGEASSSVQDKVRDLGGGHYAFLQMSNAGFIVTDEGIIVIDALASPNHAGGLLKAIREISDKPIRYLVNTHWHWDHTFGNDAFPDEAEIYSTEACKERLAKDGPDVWKKQATANPKNYEGAELVLPEVTFTDEKVIRLGGRNFIVKHLGKGHTQGDAIVMEPAARVIYAGDLLFNGLHPFMADERSDSKAWISTLRKLHDLAQPDPEKWKVVPGHGEPATPALATFLAEYIEVLRAEVKKAIDAGVPPEKMHETIELPEKFAKLEAPGFLKRNIARLAQE